MLESEPESGDDADGGGDDDDDDMSVSSSISEENAKVMEYNSLHWLTRRPLHWKIWRYRMHNLIGYVVNAADWVPLYGNPSYEAVFEVDNDRQMRRTYRFSDPQFAWMYEPRGLNAMQRLFPVGFLDTLDIATFLDDVLRAGFHGDNFSTNDGFPHPSMTLAALTMWRVAAASVNLSNVKQMELAAQEVLKDLRRFSTAFEPEASMYQKRDFFTWWGDFVTTHMDEFSWAVDTMTVLEWELHNISAGHRLPIERLMELVEHVQGHESMERPYDLFVNMSDPDTLTREMATFDLLCWIKLGKAPSAVAFFQVVCGYTDLYRYSKESFPLNEFTRGTLDLNKWDTLVRARKVLKWASFKASVEQLQFLLAQQWQNIVNFCDLLHRWVYPQVFPFYLNEPLLLMRFGGRDASGDRAPARIIDAALASTAIGVKLASEPRFNKLDANGVSNLWCMVIPTNVQTLSMVPAFAPICLWHHFSLEMEILLAPTTTWELVGSFGVESQKKVKDMCMDNGARKLIERRGEIYQFLKRNASNGPWFVASAKRRMHVYKPAGFPNQAFFRNL